MEERIKWRIYGNARLVSVSSFPRWCAGHLRACYSISHRSFWYCLWKSRPTVLKWLHAEISGVHAVPGMVMYDLNFAQRRRGCALLHYPWLGWERGESKMQMWAVEHEPVNLNSRLQSCGTPLTIQPQKELQNGCLRAEVKRVGGKVQRCHNILVLLVPSCRWGSTSFLLLFFNK